MSIKTNGRKESANVQAPRKERPAAEFKSGRLRVTIWRQDSEKGPWFNVVPSRVYKEGDHWQTSTSLGYRDLLEMAKLLDRSHSWIRREMTRIQAESGARDAEPEPDEDIPF